MSPDTKLILSLVNRISVRLPCNSGKTLDSLESDILVQQTVAALIELSKFRLGIIVNTITSVLEAVCKGTPLPPAITPSPSDEYASYDILQSQLFLLRMLSACMQHHWQHIRSNSNTTLSTDLEDPPPLEDAVAKYVVSVMCRFMYQMATMEDHDHGSATNITRTEYYSASSLTNLPTDIIVDIYKAASRVVFYISASNWSVLHSKLRARILFITSIANDMAETAELRLLECCALNAKRLGMILDEICGFFVHLKKSIQLTLAVMLRRAIWGWIETYPTEFVKLCQSKKRIDGRPDVLFDMCHGLADTTRKKAILWPLQTLLLILCPDILAACTGSSDGRGIHVKKSQFFANLSQSLKGGRTAELAAICYVDICKAANYVGVDDTSALRKIVPEIEKELKERLFDIESPLIADGLMNSLGIIIDHRYLLADSIVALFRLEPQGAMKTLLPICMNERAPPPFKLSLVKACLVISMEENRLPWSPSIACVYSILCLPLKRLFLETLRNDPYKSEPANQSSRKLAVAVDKKLKREKDAVHERLELLLDLLRLFQADPKMALYGEPGEKTELNTVLMVSIAQCLRESNQAVRDAAAEALSKLHLPHYAFEWGPPESSMEVFWKISSQVLFVLAKQLLDNREKDDSLKKLLDLLKRLLISRNDFLRTHQDTAARGSDVRERLQASISLEVVLLVLLCSSDTDICSAAITCLGHICTEINLTDNIDTPQQTSLAIIENLPIYTELTSNTVIVTGRKSQQKQIRRLLRMMPHYAPGNMAAWEEAWKRWKYLTSFILRPAEEFKEDVIDTNRRQGQAWHDKLRNPRQTSVVTNRTDTIDDDRSTEWQNYAGFLAALGGVCLMADALPDSPLSPRHTLSSSETRRPSVPSESAAMADRFVMDMVDLLLCDNIVVREWVKEILGTDLSPALYPMLFRHLETVLGKCFGPDGDPTCNMRYTLFVEQAIGVLKFVLDRMEDASDTLYTVDFSDLVCQYAKYLNKLGSHQAALKMKIKFCQLCEVLMEKKEKLTLRKEFRLRNNLLEIIVEWTSDFSLKLDTNIAYSSLEQGEKLYRDLDLACLKTIVLLLHQLPLQPSEPVHETGAGQVKSRMFYKYFTFFLKLLNRCRIYEIQSDAHSARSQEAHLSKNKENVTYLAPLKDCTILAMSNLLSANVDAGLKYSLSMGYHEDTRMRAAFMQVLTNILNQGTEFETLAETVMTDRYEKIIDMLVEEPLHITLSLCNTCPATDIDDTATALLACFASRGQTMALLKAVIEKEVQNTESETELFRRTSIATRLLSVFAKIHGADYVQSVLQPVFHTLSEKTASERTFELDSTKVGPNEDASHNKQNVVSATELFLNAICASSGEAPICFREVCHYILMAVRERFPEAKYTAVGAFIFLRFFCPAIVSPETEGLLKPNTFISRDMRRGHLIATKVIQNLANNVLFGSKETYMIVLNDFLTSNIYKVTSFLRNISSVPVKCPPLEHRLVEEKDYALLHRVLFDNMERMMRDVAARRQRLFADQEAWTAWRRMFDKFSNLLAQLGRPPEITKQDFNVLRSYTFAASNQVYAEFMRRNSHRSVEMIISKNIVYEGGTSKAGRSVLYLIARNILNDSIDFELLVYYMLQIMERFANKTIEIVIDVTLFTSVNEIPNQWIIQIIQLLSSDMCDSIAIIHIYNPNSHLRKYLKKLIRPLSPKVIKRINFAVTLAELYESIHPSEVRLPKSTMALDTEPSAVFYPVNHILQSKTNVPVTVKVGAEYVQIMTVRKQEFVYNAGSVTNDVYRISEIEDIVSNQSRGSDASHEFSFKYNKGRLAVVLSSVKRDTIMSTIRYSKRCHERSKPTNITERTIRPSDVPGRLLNMALLNIGSEDPNLRLSAYNLLYALSITFNFNVGKQLLDARDLCLPANSTSFIVSISEKLALTEPNLTLEFLNECFVGFSKSNEPLRYLCLDYMVAWLPNLALFARGGADEANIVKTKEVLRLLIDLTVARNDMYKLVQAKIWKTIATIDDILNLVLDVFVQFSNEHGVGSAQAEAMADTFVTLSNVAVRGKVLSRLRKVLQKTSFKPTWSLTDHWTWTEIAVLLRFILMLSFNNRGPVKSYVPETFHIISLVVGTGPTVVRTTVHALAVNMVQSLFTSMPLPENNVKKLQLLLTEISEVKCRLLFGISKSNVNAFTISPDTLSDVAEPIQLASLESIVVILLDVLQYAAPSADMANVWRSRWMSLVASTAFQFNPAIQPRAFVVLGCLGREEVDDDLLYQILVALRGALAIFNESDPSLVLSIMMCLKNIVRSLPSDSRYLSPLFWVAVSLVQINNGPTLATAVELLLAVLRALDANDYFAGEVMVDVLLTARAPIMDLAHQLDQLCGVNFESHFSFAMTSVLMRGFRSTSNAKDAIYQALTLFLAIENKCVSHASDYVESTALGYLAGLLPIAVKNESLKDVFRLAGLDDFDMEVSDANSSIPYHGIFDKFDIPDNTTALLLISMLSALLNLSDNEPEHLFLYGMLAEAAASIPEVFVSIYDTLLPKMNQIVLNSNTQTIMESIKAILLIACSDASFMDNKSKRAQKVLLDEVGFSSLGDPHFGTASTNSLQNAKLASEIIERIIA
ncbi:hypothetical protein BDF14DRAFT_1858538 [Spinellus fusiger]|nr:hypothetical protein BDF14DRAFT_1858538 [Spinellus fusiger]